MKQTDAILRYNNGVCENACTPDDSRRLDQREHDEFHGISNVVIDVKHQT